MRSDALSPSSLDPTISPPPETVIVPRSRDLGNGFEVHRVLPASERRMVGPFVFFDHFGPTILRAGTGLDVRPHPHIGLATVTYLFAGEILHRDSLGTVQPIRPGEVNWMTAGRGIAHSERTPPALRTHDSEVFGIQTWVGLPRDKEEVEPGFAHHSAGDLPLLEGEGAAVRVIAGEAYGARSPVAVFSAMFYADAQLASGARLDVPAGYEERAAYIVVGRAAIAGEVFDAGRLLVFRKGDAVAIRAEERSRLLLLGGEPMDGPRRVWWNFVSSSKERIEQAKADWKAGRFAPVPDDTEFIPLPE
jgi:redox-sensitive bicupin YhaK (pirin superfamily)